MKANNRICGIENCHVNFYYNTTYLSYTNHWYLKPILHFNSIQNCPVCQFEIRNRLSNSSPKDFLLTIQIGQTNGIIVIAKNIRATKTRASVVIFMDEFASKLFSGYEKDLLFNCSINIINIGFVPKFKKYAYFHIRFVIYNDFLRFHDDSNFDRIILFDCSDTVFQGDPFYKDFTKNDLIITLQNLQLKDTSWPFKNYNKYFLKINKTYQHYQNDYLINAGLILGGKKTIMIFIDVFLSRLPINEFYKQIIIGEYDDQSIIHSIVRDGDLEKYGISITISKIDDEYVSISLGCFENKKCKYIKHHNYSLGYFKSFTKNIFPFIVHQYNRFPNFVKSVQLACA